MGVLSRLFFFFNDTATTEIYTLSLHDALPILAPEAAGRVSTLRRLDHHGCHVAAPLGCYRPQGHPRASLQRATFVAHPLGYLRQRRGGASVSRGRDRHRIGRRRL